MDGSDARKYAAEMLGTFVLVFIGCGSAVIAGSKIGFLGISLAFGLTVLAMVYAIGHISGCHINPAISIAMLCAGKMKAKDTVMYIIVQCLGAVIAALVLYSIAMGLDGYALDVNGLGQNGFGEYSPAASFTNPDGSLMNPDGYSMSACFICEVMMTFLFLMVIFGSTHKNAYNGFAGLPVGLTLVMIHLVSIPVTGTSVNPARSLGPALIVGGDALNQVWLFWVAPIIGAVIAAGVWKGIFENDTSTKPAKAEEPQKKVAKKVDEEDDEDLDEEEKDEGDEEEDEDEDDEDDDEDDEKEEKGGKGKK